MKITNSEKRRIINEKIAELLGFKKLVAKKYLLGGTIYRQGKKGTERCYHPQWVYPNNFQDCQYGMPASYIPDFLCMIETYIDFVSKNSLVPHEYSVKEVWK